MKVLLLQLDGPKLPNVALMRAAAHYRALGWVVAFVFALSPAAVDRALAQHSDAVVVMASLIFERSKPLAQHLLALRADAVVGGTGWDVVTTLEKIGITTRAQDYSIYPAYRASIGFTQRGCRLECSFCKVPLTEGKVREENTVQSLWRGEGHPRHLHLLDNDFFGQPRWRERIIEMQDGFKVSFNQGINCRMLNDEAARAIASVDYRDDSFVEKRIYTAWDSLGDEKALFRGLNALKKAGVSPRHVMVYMLIAYWCPRCGLVPEKCGHGEAPRLVEGDFERRAKLREWGAVPYPMPFVRTRETIGFQCWIVGWAYDKTIDWPTWERARYQPQRLGLRREKVSAIVGAEIERAERARAVMEGGAA